MDITKINYDYSMFHSECGYITKLDLSQNKLEEINLEYLRNMGNIESLNLRSNMLRKIELDTYSTRHLRFLNLSVNDLDMISFLYNWNLEIIELAWNNLKEFDLASLQKCRKLQKLDLSHNELVELDLTPVQNWKDLTHLCLDDNPLKSIDLSPLSNCTNLQYLSLNIYHVGSIDLSPLSSCSNLRAILLQIDNTKPLDTSPLSNIFDLVIELETVATPGIKTRFYMGIQNFGSSLTPPCKERRSISQELLHPAA